MYQSQTVIGRTLREKDPPLADCRWPDDALHYIPDWVYTSQAVYDLEMDRIFRGETWNFVALEAEIPDARRLQALLCRAGAGGGRRAPTTARSTSSRTAAPTAAPSSAATPRAIRASSSALSPVVLRPEGQPAGRAVPRGVNRAGGMPKDFKTSEHGLRKLRVATRHGVIFASYSADVEPLDEYLTPEILEDFDVTFPGKKLKILGYYRNELPCNWKMYHENLKDPYHATLLHSFLVVFGLLVAGNKSTMFADKVHGRHGYMGSAKTEEKYAVVSEENRKEMRSFNDGLRLQDERFLEFVKEFDSPWSVTMATIWPNFVIQREMNTLGVRQIIPNGPDSMIMQWTMFGYEDDTPEMERHRLRQGNLMGPAGFLGLEDNEAMKFVQEGLRRCTTDVNVLKLDADQVGASDSLISEAAIRAMYVYYRQVMGF